MVYSTKQVKSSVSVSCFLFFFVVFVLCFRSHHHLSHYRNNIKTLSQILQRLQLALLLLSFRVPNGSKSAAAVRRNQQKTITKEYKMLPVSGFNLQVRASMMNSTINNGKGAFPFFLPLPHAFIHFYN